MMIEQPAKKQPPGLPAWLATFADLMTLLMCFFVLLLSFAQKDQGKFKEVGGSLQKAFGVQREIEASAPPRGTSVIAREFSPGKPEPTPFNEVRQKTTQDFRKTLEFDEVRTKGLSKDKSSTEEKPDDDGANRFEKKQNDDLNQLKNQEAGEQVAEAVAQEILDGNIEVEAFGQRVIIRVLENNSFESGYDELKPQALETIKKISEALGKMPGDISIGGHTDNIPIYNSQFKSNWSLSSARAVAVAHALLNDGKIKSNRLSVTGFADSKPLFLNDSSDHRKRNRRVEITLIQGERPDYQKLESADVTKFDGKPLKRISRDLNTKVFKPSELAPIDINQLNLNYEQYQKDQGGLRPWNEVSPSAVEQTE